LPARNILFALWSSGICVVQHLTSLFAADVEVTMEIHGHVAEGIPENVVRIVSENCKTLKFQAQGFETE
jgi:hypothetical protein